MAEKATAPRKSPTKMARPLPEKSAAPLRRALKPDRSFAVFSRSSGATVLSNRGAGVVVERRRTVPLQASTVPCRRIGSAFELTRARSEEHTSELQSHVNLVCRLLLEKKK